MQPGRAGHSAAIFESTLSSMASFERVAVGGNTGKNAATLKLSL